MELAGAGGRGGKRGWRSSAGESERTFSEPNIKYYSMDSYQLSIEMLFTEKVIRMGRGGFEWEWRKSRGLRELGEE
jgi:hypothetical protein